MKSDGTPCFPSCREIPCPPIWSSRKPSPVTTALPLPKRMPGFRKRCGCAHGRGARGTLTRIGHLLWPRLLEAASFSEKAQAQFIRTLPPGLRPKPALELLARFLREHPEAVTVHTLDLDLLLVDRASAATAGQHEVTPICHVTVGLIQEALFWPPGVSMMWRNAPAVLRAACSANSK